MSAAEAEAGIPLLPAQAARVVLAEAAEAAAVLTQPVPLAVPVDAARQLLRRCSHKWLTFILLASPIFR